MIPITATLALDEREIQEEFIQAAGPGGQNVNKVASKIELVFDVGRTRVLGDDVKERLRALAGSRMDGAGCLRITSQESRDRLKNLESARAKLVALVRVLRRKIGRQRWINWSHWCVKPRKFLNCASKAGRRSDRNSAAWKRNGSTAKSNGSVEMFHAANSGQYFAR